MATCEKCWKDASERMLSEPQRSQTHHYLDLINERRKNPCSLKERAGHFWDEENQCDRRKLKESK
jgi:hypothetical protein